LNLSSENLVSQNLLFQTQLVYRYTTVAPSTTLNAALTSPLTLEARFRVEGGAAGGFLLHKAGAFSLGWTDAGGLGLSLEAEIDGVKMPTARAHTQRSYDDGAWHHVAAVHDAHVVAVYVDGVLAAGPIKARGGLNRTGTTAAHALTIGGDAAGSFGSHFRGEIDELRVWNIKAVADAAAAAALYTHASPPISGANGLLLYYPCNEAAAGGSKIVDASGNGNHAYLGRLDATLSSSNGVSARFPKYVASTASFGNAPIAASEDKGITVALRGASADGTAAVTFLIATLPSAGKLFNVNAAGVVGAEVGLCRLESI
jgi:hypothetical protein